MTILSKVTNFLVRVVCSTGIVYIKGLDCKGIETKGTYIRYFCKGAACIGYVGGVD